MSDLKWYSIQMIDGVSCERSAFNLADLVKEVNKFMRNHTYHEDEILTINYLGDDWQATPMKETTMFEEKKYRVTVTTTHKRVYYIEAGDWETAQDMVEEPAAYGLVENARDYFKPDSESEFGEEIEVEEM